MLSSETRTTELNWRRGLVWAAGGAVLALGLSTAFWWESRPGGNAKAAPVPSAHVPVSANDAASDTAPSDQGLQVDLGPDDLKKARIGTVRVEMRPVSIALRVPGVVSVNEYREVHVTPLAGGVVRQVSVVLGDHVRRGQTLAVIFSSELSEAETAYLAVQAESDADHKKLERTQHLVTLGAASQQEDDDVTAEHAVHAAHVRAALEKLKLFGADEHQIAGLKQAEQIDANLAVPAPIAGTVLTRSANLGLVATASQELFTVADLSSVWVMASLNERDFPKISVGTPAAITAPAYPGRVWRGRVVYIQPQVDPVTRTAQARIEVANPGETLRLAMFTDVEFASASGQGLTVPESTVQAIGEKQYVFLPVSDSDGSFTVRQVRLGGLSQGFYEVLGGLKPGDEVVRDGSFTLKAEAIRQHPEL